jgi:hypothetical protein
VPERVEDVYEQEECRKDRQRKDRQDWGELGCCVMIGEGEPERDPTPRQMMSPGWQDESQEETTTKSRA